MTKPAAAVTAEVFPETDEEIVAPAGPTAFSPIEDLVEAFGASMFRVAKSIVGDPNMAEDVVQDALLRVWMHLDDYRGDAPLKNWVLRITHNCAVSAVRKRRDEARDPMVLAESESPSTMSDPARVAAGRAAVDELWHALDLLDETSRSIVVLREIERMSYEEIGELLNLALPTVKTRLFRARRTLSENLKEWR
jgi:RNA polymerase sigma-70 factor, ECF subfamily